MRHTSPSAGPTCRSSRLFVPSLGLTPSLGACAKIRSRRIFVTESVSVRRILEHIGEPADPPGIAPARGPPAWEEGAEPVALLDSFAQPQPDFQFDQTLSW